MRDLKFRAWDKDAKYIMSWREVKDHFKDTGWIFETDQLEFMQYTGLKDKNGVEIYEGDVLKRHQDYSQPLIGKVIYQDDRFLFLKPEFGGYNLYYSNDDIEVIGNIYENSELLEGK